MMKFLRRWNLILHRDIGYLSVALIIVYGISGLAVNHMNDWNPNYLLEKNIVSIRSVKAAEKDSMIAEILPQLNITEIPMNVFRPDPETIQLFFPNKTISVDIPTGKVLIEHTQERRVLFEMNQLHLNAVKGIWTYIADIFAISLIFMGISGIFMLRGPSGLFGRGKWFIGLGTLIPLIYWLYYLFLF
jgi:uncharacterized protein